MDENRTFQLAILISIVLHFALFLTAPRAGALPKKQLFEPIKVAYFKPEEIKKKELPGKQEKLVGQKPGLSYYRLPSPTAPEAMPEVKKEDFAAQPLAPQPLAKPEQVKKEEPTVETIISGSRAVIRDKGKKFETVVNDEKDSGKKAAYIGYYRLVREKIRYYADKNYIKERSASQGEVLLSFVVASSGELLHIMIIDARSSKDLLLRDIAINSIRDASPFTAFPQGMNQYQITFNVIISFELNK